MKYLLPIFGTALLGACSETNEQPPAPTPPPLEAPNVEFTAETQAAVEQTFSRPLEVPEHYTDGWEVTPGWPGEYPPGFSVMTTDVTVKGRETMDPTTAKTIDCPLPAMATYQEWNGKRVSTDDLRFAVATKLFNIEMLSDTSMEVPGEKLEDPPVTLSLKAGDTLTYKRYLGEGFAIIGYEDADYEINEMDLQGVSDIDTAADDGRGTEEMWVRVTCDDPQGSRAWLRYDDAIATTGIGPTPVMGYAESRDITAEDIPEMQRQMEYDAAAEIE